MIGARLDLAKEVVFLDPDVNADIIFIEPAEDDYTFFGMGALNFWSKDRAASHGYAAVRVDIRSEADLEKYRGKLKGLFVLRQPPRESETRFTPLAHRYTDDELREMAEARGPGRGDFFSGPPRFDTCT